MNNNFAGRHLIMDAVVHDVDLLKCTRLADEYMYSITDITDMQLVIPVISMKFPFNNELHGFVKRLQREGTSSEIITECAKYVKMKEDNDTGVSSIGIWNTSHCASHSWTEVAYISIDLFSCKDYDVDPVIEFTLDHYNIKRLDYCNMERYIGSPQIIKQNFINRVEIQMNSLSLIPCMYDTKVCPNCGLPTRHPITGLITDEKWALMNTPHCVIEEVIDEGDSTIGYNVLCWNKKDEFRCS